MALDVAITVGSVILARIFLFGGFVTTVGGLDVRLRTPLRTIIWLVLLLLLRRLLFRGAGIFGFAPGCWRLVAPDADDAVLFPSPPGARRRAILAAAGIAAAVAVVMYDIVRRPDWIVDYGDPLYLIWQLNWVSQQLIADPARLFDANIFYPERLTLALSDPAILPALVQAPMVALGVQPVVAYNLLFLSVVWLSGFTTYLFVERLTGSALAAFISGVVFACYPYRVDHIAHLELQMTQWMPLGLLALHLFISTSRWRYAAAFAAVMVAQVYSSMYYGLFFAMYAGVIGAGLVWVYRPALRRLLLPSLAATILAVLAAVPLVRPFVAAQPLKGDRQREEVAQYSATIHDYFKGHRFSLWWSDPSAQPERALFPGAAPLALAVVGLAPPLSAIRAVYAVGLVAAFDISRGLNGVIYPYLYDWVPPFRGIRGVSRFSIVVGLTLAVLSAYGAVRLIRLCSTSAGRAGLAAAISVIVVVDAMAKVDVLVPAWLEPPSIYEHVRTTPGVVLAELPVADDNAASAVFQYFSLWHRKPMVNGFAGFLPDSYVQLKPALMDFPRGDAVDELLRRGVTHVTLNCALPFVPKARCEEMARMIAERQELQLVMETSWEGEPVRLYTLSRGASAGRGGAGDAAFEPRSSLLGTTMEHNVRETAD